MKSTNLSSVFFRATAILCIFSFQAISATLQTLATKSDLIVVGTVDTRIESRDAVTFDINIARVLKGDKSLQVISVHHAWRNANIGHSDQIVDLTIDGIWFLYRAQGGSWDVYPVNGRDGLMIGLFFPASLPPPATYKYSADTPLTDAIASELAAGAQLHGLPPDPSSLELIKLNSPTITAILNNLAISNNPGVRALAIAGLLSHSPKNAIRELVQQWPSIRKDPSREYVISALRNTFRDTDPSSIATLIAFADTEAASGELRNAIIRALAAIHTRESLPFLAGLLSSPSASDRMSAIIGLSSFANGCPPQTPDNVASMEYMQFKNPSPYRTPETVAAFAFGPVDSERENELVQFWTAWWMDHQAAILN